VITEAEAVRSAQSHLRNGQGAVGPTISFSEIGGEQKATVHWWHAEGGYNVEGDQATVLLNADSGKVFAVARKWRRVDPALLRQPASDERQALRAADLAVGSDVPGQIIGRSIVQVGGDAPTRSAMSPCGASATANWAGSGSSNWTSTATPV